MVEAFVALADTLVSDYDLLDYLGTLCQRCVDVLEVAAAGVLLADQKTLGLQALAASSEQMRVLEVFESQHDEGPCMDAYQTGRQVMVADLARASARWPSFTSKALGAGFGAVFGFPLRLRDQRLGALNLLRHGPGHLDEVDVRAAQALADAATIGILQERGLAEARTLSDRLQHALDSRVVIEQAKGIVSTQLGLDMEQAFGRLRRFSQDHNQPLREVVQRILAGTLAPDELHRPE